jgi:hypothetical protein
MGSIPYVDSFYGEKWAYNSIWTKPVSSSRRLVPGAESQRRRSICKFYFTYNPQLVIPAEMSLSMNFSRQYVQFSQTKTSFRGPTYCSKVPFNNGMSSTLLTASLSAVNVTELHRGIGISLTLRWHKEFDQVPWNCCIWSLAAEITGRTLFHGIQVALNCKNYPTGGDFWAECINIHQLKSQW